MSPAAAQTGTSTAAPPLFTGGDALLASGIVLSAFLARPLDERYAKRLQDSSTQANEHLHTISTAVRVTVAPGSYVIGTSMYAAGRLFKIDKMATLGLRGTEALVVGEAVGGVLKGFIGRQRPYVEPQDSHSIEFMRGFRKGDDYQSFPSGHSLAAFGVAAAVTSETSGWWPGSRWIIGPAMFGGATLTAMSRMYDNKHWMSDVIVGGGLGTFAGLKVVRYHNAHPGSRFDNVLLGASIVPTSGGGHALHWSISPAPHFGEVAGRPALRSTR